MPTPDKKIDILKAAGECFARFGYDKTTLNDIGKLVGLNKTSLYYYYKSKEAIFAEVLVSEIKQAIEAYSGTILEIPGCREKIIVYLRKKIRYVQQLMNVHNVSMEAFRNVQPMFANLFQQITEQEVAFISSILERGIAERELKPCDTARVARAMLTVADAVKLQALKGTDARFIDQLDMDALEENVVFAVSLILDGLVVQRK